MRAIIPHQYKPAELQLAIDALCNNHYHKFSENDAHGIIIALHRLGLKIVKTGAHDR